ncbi:MAG: hypothetical protein LBE78_01670 [Burkholderiaceae bacterium]|nr:hypothetical protein [Burkholderiaceae bacterium]
MDIDFRGFDHLYLWGERATHPIRPPKLGASGALAALLVLAGGKPAASSRLASPPDDDLLGRVQLRFLG